MMLEYEENDEGEIVSIKLSEWERYGKPLIRHFPALQAAYTDAEIIEKATQYIVEVVDFDWLEEIKRHADEKYGVKKGDE